MITIEHVADVLRGAVSAAGLQCVTPDSLVSTLGLSLFGSSTLRPQLRGRDVVYDDTAPLREQQYQIARAACAWVLTQYGLIRWLSPHDLAVELCDVGSAPRPARVTSLASARVRLRSGWAS